ncbi:GNAT family N-acetyltransferase [Thalassobacillus hwangdonensis]|uniref:GNAT family N-acetyltransferase n=1 Tax=Thalassobacillus hwangdonensis TaxID=546108 RepID=A0ABW3L191_9BACI
MRIKHLKTILELLLQMLRNQLIHNDYLERGVGMDITIEYTTTLGEDEKKRVWEILCECDKEFVPPLSARENSAENELLGEGAEDAEPVEHFEEMIEENFLLAKDQASGEVVGFLTFRNGYECHELRNHAPSNYITTICVTKTYRNNGITKRFYHHMNKENLPEQAHASYVTTRTWNGNGAHIKVLETIGFEVAERLENHRGEGIDTIYFAKPM